MNTYKIGIEFENDEALEKWVDVNTTKDDELPDGVLVVQTAGHLTCVKYGELYDTWDCSAPTRCVYGYWTKGGGE